VLLFYSLSSQPEENLTWVSAVLFCVGFGVSAYFLLTHDFLEAPRKLEIVNTIGRWIMQISPSLPWIPIHPNYVSGIAAIATPFIIYPLWKFRKDARKRVFIPLVGAGLGTVVIAIFMATSRGVLLAMASAAGVWVLGRILLSGRINLRLGRDAVFPSLVLIYLAAVLLFLFLGPASFGGNVVQTSPYGDGSRAEVFERSAYLVADFPITGGGLGSYPGLYSQYMLDIPYYYLPNAHNMFLDVFIEQGIPGGILFLVLYIAGIWQAARMVIATKSSDVNVFGWLALATLVIAFVHGMVDDYLYNGKGAILSMVPVGVMAVSMQFANLAEEKTHSRAGFVILSAGIIMMGLFLMNADRVRSAWFANMGAVQMARVELTGFPVNQWTGTEIVPLLEPVEVPLLSSLEADPANRTANHRLGLIAVSRRDFFQAAVYLEAAHAQSPGHRGITKALGFCYVWLAEFEKAQIILKGIPEAGDELDAYTWWWQTQGRSDLSAHASYMRTLLAADLVRP
jgi:O-antigen ligase